MTSSAGSVSETLAGYVAWRVTAEQLVSVVAAAYYDNRGVGSGEWLRPLMDVVERAHPGIIELRGTAERPGFAVRLQERPFPKQYEGALRDVVSSMVRTGPTHSPLPTPHLWTRFVRAVRRFFSA